MSAVRAVLLGTLGVVAALAAAAALAGWIAFRERVGGVEQVGDFEIVTIRVPFLAGWNEGDLRRAFTERYELRHDGRSFTLAGRAGMAGDDTATYRSFNAIITIPAPEPAVIVNVGDPNNTSWFYLLRERDGGAVSELLGESSGGVSADWLDAPRDGAPTERDVAVHRARLDRGPGGRWVLLGDATVLDTRTLAAHALAQPPEGLWLNPFAPAIAMSPDGDSFVRLASGASPENAPALVVFDIGGRTSYALPIERRVMRYTEWDELDAAWLDHYFAWKADSSGTQRLSRRPDVAPRPWHGRLTTDASDGYREYRVGPVTRAMHERVAAFLARAMGAERPAPETFESTSVEDVRIGGATVSVAFYDDHVSVWMPRGTDSRPVAEIARRFDEELRGGAYDSLFAP